MHTVCSGVMVLTAKEKGTFGVILFASLLKHYIFYEKMYSFQVFFKGNMSSFYSIFFLNEKFILYFSEYSMGLHRTIKLSPRCDVMDEL